MGAKLKYLVAQMSIQSDGTDVDYSWFWLVNSEKKNIKLSDIWCFARLIVESQNVELKFICGHLQVHDLEFNYLIVWTLKRI